MFPDRFADQAIATAWVARCITWYNTAHRQSGMGLLTPQMVHQGQTARVLAAREHTRMRAATAHPERFVSGQPHPPRVADAVWINPPHAANTAPAHIDHQKVFIP